MRRAHVEMTINLADGREMPAVGGVNGGWSELGDGVARMVDLACRGNGIPVEQISSIVLTVVPDYGKPEQVN